MLERSVCGMRWRASPLKVYTLSYSILFKASHTSARDKQHQEAILNIVYYFSLRERARLGQSVLIDIIK